MVASSLSLPPLLSCWRCLPSSPRGWDGVLPSTLNCSLKDGKTLPRPLKRTEENLESFLDSKNLPQNEPGCDSCSTPEDGWDEVLSWHECCDTVISARESCCCFLPGAALPVCHSKMCRGHTGGTGCAHIYLIGSQAPVFDLCFLLGSAFSPFLFTLLLPPPSPCLQAKEEQDLWSPLPCPDFKSW